MPGSNAGVKSVDLSFYMMKKSYILYHISNIFTYIFNNCCRFVCLILYIFHVVYSWGSYRSLLQSLRKTTLFSWFDAVLMLPGASFPQDKDEGSVWCSLKQEDVVLVEHWDLGSQGITGVQGLGRARPEDLLGWGDAGVDDLMWRWADEGFIEVFLVGGFGGGGDQDWWVEAGWGGVEGEGADLTVKHWISWLFPQMPSCPWQLLAT